MTNPWIILLFDLPMFILPIVGVVWLITEGGGNGVHIVALCAWLFYARQYRKALQNNSVCNAKDQKPFSAIFTIIWAYLVMGFHLILLALPIVVAAAFPENPVIIICGLIELWLVLSTGDYIDNTLHAREMQAIQGQYIRHTRKTIGDFKHLLWIILGDNSGGTRGRPEEIAEREFKEIQKDRSTKDYFYPPESRRMDEYELERKALDEYRDE